MGITIKINSNESTKSAENTRSAIVNNNNGCNHPPNAIWQYKKHWLCCKCWHQEEGIYNNQLNS